ncbi:MAG: STAS domain-containing protein [Terriglobales bacterium]
MKNPASSRTFSTRPKPPPLSVMIAVVLGEERRRIVLDINVRKRSEVQLIQLRGPLRMGPAVDGLRQAMEEVIGNGDHRIAINLAEVSMIDSSGIGLLVRFLASTKKQGGNIKLIQPSKFAVQTLKLVGVLNLFEIFEDDDAAVASFS